MKGSQYNAVRRRVVKWCNGFASREKSFMNIESYGEIERFLIEPKKEKMDFIKLGTTCNMLSTWYAADFLEKYFKKENNCIIPLKQSMLWGFVDYMLYEEGKMGDIAPVNLVYMCLSACNMLILQNENEAERLLRYAISDRINSPEMSGTVCQFIVNMYSLFFMDNKLFLDYVEPLDNVYQELLDKLSDETSLDINDSVNKVCDFHLSRTKTDQEFDIETIMLFPSEILAPFLLKKRIKPDMVDLEHPLVKELVPIVESLSGVDNDPVYVRVIDEIGRYKIRKLNNGSLFYVRDDCNASTGVG